MQGSNDVYFATSNAHKYGEARFILRGSGLSLHRLLAKGTEIQSDDVSEIASVAASAAYSKHLVPLFVEDTMLTVTALGGFPGTYASHAYRTIGPAGVLRLLGDSDDRSAEFASAVAFSDGPGRPRLFVGRLRGRIAAQSAGTGGFGFDPIFIPEGDVRTLAEMTMAEKCLVSHRSQALRAFASWFKKSRGGQPL